jgi:plasmid stabilization system protein ParE
LTTYRIVVDHRAELDVEDVLAWYEQERPGLGSRFLAEIRAAYARILDGPFKYQVLRSGVRHALLRVFPYSLFFVVDGDVIRVFAVLHARRSPSEWQRRID